MTESAGAHEGRLIIVSNRLPMTVGIENGEMTMGAKCGRIG